MNNPIAASCGVCANHFLDQALGAMANVLELRFLRPSCFDPIFR